MFGRVLPVASMVAALASCVLAADGSRASAGALPPAVATALALHSLPAEALSAWVAPVDAGKPVWHWQSETAFAPASTLKTLTTQVALDRLGPNWRGQVRLLTRAPLTGGEADGDGRTLAGDLVLRGEAHPDFDLAALDRLLRTLRAQGIRHIAGDLVVDRSFFRPGRHDVGLPPFDETPEFRYNVIPDALFLASNLVTLELAAVGAGVRVVADPDLPGVRWSSALALIDARCSDWEREWRTPEVERLPDGSIIARLRGAFPRDCKVSTQIAVIDRDEYLGRLLPARWRAFGGTLAGRVRFQDTAAGEGAPLRELALVRSRTLAEFARDIQRRSDNPITRMVYLALGAQTAAPGEATLAAAERTVRNWLAEHAITAPGLVLDNGSGLSRSERIAARTLGEVLRVARRSPWWPEFAYGLPVAGRDGSLARRLRDSRAAAAPTPARLKTGTLRDVGALAGYVTAADGREYVFVAMVNDPEVRPGTITTRAQPVLDALVEWVAEAGWRTEPWAP